jgi:hypothetical protein
VAELLYDRTQPASPQPSAGTPSRGGFDATAAQVAQRWGVKAAWVRANAEALGGRRLGTGPKARHRFNLEIADERIAAMQAERPDAPAAPTRRPTQPRSRRRSSPSDVPLLPIKGRRPPP